MLLDATYPGAFLAGLLSFLSPCVLPLVPPYLCFLAGTTLEELVETNGITNGADGTGRGLTSHVAASAVMFVAGFTTVFVFLGATASALRPFLVARYDLFGIDFGLAEIAGVVIVLFGLHFLGLIRVPFLHREARYRHEARPAGFLGAYLIGLAFAFGWTPCIGPVLAAIIAVASVQDTIGEGMALLAVYSAGLGVPFIASAFALRPFVAFLSRFRSNMRRVEQAMGGLLVLTGAFFILGWFERGAFFLLETFPVLGTIG